jgi:outer membrane protein assembly factor BamB
MLGQVQTDAPRVRAAIRSTRGVAMVAALAGGMACVLLLGTFVQTRRTDPLNNPSLVRLREKFSADTASEDLKHDIRAMDLLARKAFFTSQYQIRTGGLVLLFCVAVFVIASKIHGELTKLLPDPESLPSPDALYAETVWSRRGVTAFGAGLAFAAGIAAWITHSDLATPMPGATGAGGGSPPTTGGPATAGGTGGVPTAGVATNVMVAAVADFPKREDVLRNWPNFRGPDGNGVAHVKDAPAAWDIPAGKGLVWKTEMPKGGFSSPIVWDDVVYLTGGNAEAREVYAFDARTGAARWTHPVTGVPGAPAKSPEVNDNTGWAASTPATDGKRIAAIFATGEIVCLDPAGKRLWARALGAPANHYAHSSSLLIFRDLLLVQFDDSDKPRLLALKTATGAEAWSVKRAAISWASPICVETKAGWQAILADSAGVGGYDALTGKKLWSEDCLGGEVAPSPAYDGGMVFVANDKASGVGIRLDGGADAVKASVEWKLEDNLPDTASLLAANGFVFYATSAGPLLCLGAQDGKTAWEHDFGSGFYASPIRVGDRVYATDLEGVTHVVKLAGAYESVADAPTGEKVSSTPAFVEGRVFLRGEKHLFCVGAADAGVATAQASAAP